MKKLLFTEDYSYDIDDRTRHNIPAGWSGEVADEVAKDALKKDVAKKPNAAVIDATNVSGEVADEEKAP